MKLFMSILPFAILGCLEGPTGPSGERGAIGEKGGTGLQGLPGTIGKDGVSGKSGKFEIFQGFLMNLKTFQQDKISYWTFTTVSINQKSAVSVFVRKTVANVWVVPSWAYFTSPTLVEDSRYWVETGLHTNNAPSSYVLIEDDILTTSDWEYKIVVLNENTVQ